MTLAPWSNIVSSAVNVSLKLYSVFIHRLMCILCIFKWRVNSMISYKFIRYPYCYFTPSSCIFPLLQIKAPLNFPIFPKSHKVSSLHIQQQATKECQRRRNCLSWWKSHLLVAQYHSVFFFLKTNRPVDLHRLSKFYLIISDSVWERLGV